MSLTHMEMYLWGSCWVKDQRWRRSSGHREDMTAGWPARRPQAIQGSSLLLTPPLSSGCGFWPPRPPWGPLSGMQLWRVMWYWDHPRLHHPPRPGLDPAEASGWTWRLRGEGGCGDQPCKFLASYTCRLRPGAQASFLSVSLPSVFRQVCKTTVPTLYG